MNILQFFQSFNLTVRAVKTIRHAAVLRYLCNPVLAEGQYSQFAQRIQSFEGVDVVLQPLRHMITNMLGHRQIRGISLPLYAKVPGTRLP